MTSDDCCKTHYIFVASIKTLVAIATAFLFVGCEKIESGISRKPATTGSTYPVNLVELWTERRYDQQYVIVGGFLGPYYFGPAPALYSVSEHITIGDASLAVWLSGSHTALAYENLCEHIGSYVRVSGKFDRKNRMIDVEKFTVLKEPEPRMERAACEKLTDF